MTSFLVMAVMKTARKYTKEGEFQIGVGLGLAFSAYGLGCKEWIMHNA
jgi:hypothetical protein